MLSCDWLQIRILHADINSQTFTPAQGYDFKLTDKKTQNFSELWEVRHHGQLMAWITAKPKEKFLDSNLMIIKFENSYLYADFLDRKIANFLSFNKLTFVSFTRLDLAFDFCSFDNGMKPREFVRHYLAGAIRKSDKTKIGLHGSNKDAFEPEYIKWGTNNSDLSYYMYDKVIEMHDVKHKAHIAQRWLSAGFDMSSVWRLEFRIKGGLKVLVDTLTGEAKTLQEYGLELLNAQNTKQLYATLYTRYFDFRQPNGQDKIERMARIELFKDFRSYGFIVRDQTKAESQRSNRMEKVFIKMMCEENEELNRFYPAGYRDHDSRVLQEMIAIKISQNGLRDWALNKSYVPNECLVGAG